MNKHSKFDSLIDGSRGVASYVSRRNFGKLVLAGSIGFLSTTYIHPALSQFSRQQSGWRWCTKCQGLFAEMNGDGVCPASGGHRAGVSYNYRLLVLPGNKRAIVTDSNDNRVQPGWMWCNKCQSLFAGMHKASSNCPAGGQHDSKGSNNYGLYFVENVESEDTGPEGTQGNWAWCGKCQGLYTTEHNAGICPEGGEHEMGGGSYNYFLAYIDD